MRFADPDTNLKKRFELIYERTFLDQFTDVKGTVESKLANYGGFFFGSEILWNKQMDRQKWERKIQIWTDVPSF